jgi:hypothetical protein
MRRALAVAGMLAAGCGGGAAGDAGPGDATPADAAADAGPTRAYALASSGASLVLEPQPAIVLGPADLAGDVDAVLIHQEFYGLPWAEFASGAEPPPEWVAIMDDLADGAAAVGPVFLSLQLVSGAGRHYLADRTVVNSGTLSTEAGWSAPCYDFDAAADGAQRRAAYLAYVDWMVRRFQPRWVNVAIEMNMFMDCGDAAWNALVDVERAAYDAVKAVDPSILAFPSIQLEFLYGWAGCGQPDRDTCYDAAYARLAQVARDRFAVTSFPYLVAALRDDPALDDGWFTRAGDRGGERTVIAETGWLAEPMVVLRDTSCIEAIPVAAGAPLAHLERALAPAETGAIDLVTWVSDRDLLPTAMLSDCPCAFDADWCAFLDAYRQSAGVDIDAQAGAEYALKQFGAMGLRDHDGNARADLYARWQQARALPWAGPP